jgi:hypothetical protein
MKDWIIRALIFLTLFVLNECAIPCPELSSALRIPCLCRIEGKSYIGVDCNQAVFTSEVPSIPYNAPVSTFSQRQSGLLSIPTQVRIENEYKEKSYKCIIFQIFFIYWIIFLSTDIFYIKFADNET